MAEILPFRPIWGRKPRVYHHHVPLLSGVRRRMGIAGPTSLAPAVDYTRGLPANLGVMMNDRLGCCTAAGLYHRRQVVTFNVNPPMDTQPDSMVQKWYELSTGYNPSNPLSDQGGVEQDVLTLAVKQGIPLADGSVDKLLTFIEIDPHNAIDVDWAINDCLGVYIGFDVPAYLEQGLTAPGSVWDLDGSADSSVVGGHCVYVGGQNAGVRKLISWGSTYEMTSSFWLKYVDECYALIGQDLVSARTGMTVLNVPIQDLLASAQAWQAA